METSFCGLQKVQFECARQGPTPLGAELMSEQELILCSCLSVRPQGLWPEVMSLLQ